MVGNGIGRVLYGKLSDNFGRKPVIIFALAFQAVLLVALSLWPVANYTVNEAGKRVCDASSFTGVLVLMLVLSWFIGANYGANLSVFPAMTKDFFGLKSFGLNYGLVVCSGPAACPSRMPSSAPSADRACRGAGRPRRPRR